MNSRLPKIFSSVKDYFRMIKIEHSLFALPFAISSALLASQYLGFKNIQYMNFFWIILCMISARSCGMGFNRIFDAKIDALNVRTASREIPSGRISKQAAWVFSLSSLAIFVYSSFQLPELCRILLPIAIAWLWLYSLIKRVSFLCHFFLGSTLAGASLGAWIAITDAVDSLGPVYLSLAVLFWVAGFDIVYAIQDIEFDRSQRLHSIPARFGVKNAIMISRLSHFLSVLFLYLCAESLHLGLYFRLGIMILIGAIFLEQKLVKESKIEAAFFTVNSWASVLIMLSVIAELL